ncbi:glycosyl hydrolase family 95 catalytic domain-containing protein [Flavobacterium sp. W1B]|uniref:glycosyl hydrolase family 95 catalytic domain-containing protein n=1 Tax=Flavobacterium sp. W1B TaxID=3394146 RepID=UPI0039BD132E
MNLIPKSPVFIKLFFFFLLSLGVQSVYSQRPKKVFVPKYKGVFTSPAKLIPTASAPDAPIAGNGDVGIVFGGTPDKQTIYISKNDFWKAKKGYPDGGVTLPGGLNISIPELKGATFYAEQVLANGNINVIFKKKGLTFTLKAFVPADNNVVIIEMLTSGRESCNVTLDIWSQTGFESRNESGEKEGVFYATRHFDSPELDWPSHVALAMNVFDASGKSFVLNPSSKVTVVIGVATNIENEDYLNTACYRAKNCTPKIIKKLNDINNLFWQNFWAKSRIDIGDPELEKYYYGSQYLLACSSRNKNFAPAMGGNPITADAIRFWEGDYHTSQNYQASWWGAYSSNHIELTEPYDKPILEYMGKAKEHAKELMEVRGVYYPMGIGPKGFSSAMYPLTEEDMMDKYGIKDLNIEGGQMFGGQRSNALSLSVNMFQRFYHTYDKRYVTKVYPFIREVANFWEDYLKYEKGLYNNYNDNFWEVGPWTENWRNDLKSGDINNTKTLGLLKMFCKGIIEMCTFLNVDKDRIGKWTHIQEHLPAVPTVETNGEIRIKAADKGTGSGNEKRTKPGFGRTMAYSLVFPSDITGVKSTPEFAEILRQEVERWDTNPGDDAGWGNLNSGFDTYFTTAIRVGYDPEKVLQKLKQRIAKSALPNFLIAQPGGMMETLSAVPSCINEMLLQSYEGMIRVFPAWPINRDASFEDLRTYGAFLVSSAKKNGEVQYIKIKSDKGRTCTIENPWNGKKPIVTEDGKPITPKIKENLIIFPTQQEKVYLIKYEK